MKRFRLSALTLTALSFTAVAHAHSLDSGESGWGLSVLPGVALPMLVSAVLYTRGVWRLLTQGLHDARRWHGRSVSFACGLAFLALALLSPLDRWGSASFALHMVQHEVLMLLAAPLLVLGRPLPAFLWGLPVGARLAVARASRSSGVQSVWSTLVHPATAWILHAIILWVWHAPLFFDAAVRHQSVHDLQHFTFLASALLFWTALFQERERNRQGAGVLYLFTTTIHTGVLGALLTFASHPWYSAYDNVVPVLSLSTLEDQQIGGLIMWIPGALVYVGAGLTLLARWIVPAPSRATGKV